MPQWATSLGAQGEWLVGGPKVAPETPAAAAALVIPPVGCATSYEELIAFFRSLAEQQQPSRHGSMHPDDGESLCQC